MGTDDNFRKGSMFKYSNPRHVIIRGPVEDMEREDSTIQLSYCGAISDFTEASSGFKISLCAKFLSPFMFGKMLTF
jgi:hypothetical protein